MALNEALWKEKLYQSVSNTKLDTLSYKKETPSAKYLPELVYNGLILVDPISKIIQTWE